MGRRDRSIARAPRRLVGTGAALVCAAGLVVTGSLPAPAAPDPGVQKRAVDGKIDRLKDHLDDTSVALSRAYEDLHSTQDKLPAARAALDAARATADAAQQAEAEATQELEVARANESKAANDLRSATQEVDDGRERIAQFAAQIYQEQGFGQLDVALSSTEPQDFADRLALVDTVLDVQAGTMQRLATEQANLTALEDHLSALRADSAAKKKEAEAALARATAAREAADQAKVELESLAATQERQAAAYEDQLAADKKQLASMEREQERLRRILVKRAEEARRKAAAEAARRAAAEAARQRAAEAAARKRAEQQRKNSGGGGGGGSSQAPAPAPAPAPPPPPAPSSSGFLSRPVRTGWVSSEFGMRFHPVFHYWKLHSGRDYAVACGTPVYAAAPGTVISAGWGGGYGNRVVIDHGLVSGAGLASTYNHLTSISVWGGQVGRGQLIGYSGTTGTSTGCHLHFETLKNGGFDDPRHWLNTLG
ncbi:M23 family metallopeptidase [Phycicoccus flavus]|uniref:Peptidoglycan DD-metalloendopeptidase family protein n=1 Tax=Phycicoccus flavus TaxID=2502783 RepID=A0A8T6R6Z2_9MICO|nr:M23 family metallopeptidase [Phycicoccus flavus]NHA69220.1 peptidoglycan DD-metalloendopeptidase family protein [Phycicoccus flavus]